MIAFSSVCLSDNKDSPSSSSKTDKTMAEQALIDTLALLEWRLQRLEFLLSTPLNANGDPSNPAPIPTRFRRLEYSLQQLGRNSETAGELLRMSTSVPSFLVVKEDATNQLKTLRTQTFSQTPPQTKTTMRSLYHPHPPKSSPSFSQKLPLSPRQPLNSAISQTCPFPPHLHSRK